jgi:hypothetical protein
MQDHFVNDSDVDSSAQAISPVKIYSPLLNLINVEIQEKLNFDENPKTAFDLMRSYLH